MQFRRYGCDRALFQPNFAVDEFPCLSGKEPSLVLLFMIEFCGNQFSTERNLLYNSQSPPIFTSGDLSDHTPKDAAYGFQSIGRPFPRDFTEEANIPTGKALKQDRECLACGIVG